MRPRIALGVLFMTLEDQTGVSDQVVWPKVDTLFHALVRHAIALTRTSSCSAKARRRKWQTKGTNGWSWSRRVRS